MAMDKQSTSNPSQKPIVSSQQPRADKSVDQAKKPGTSWEQPKPTSDQR